MLGPYTLTRVDASGLGGALEERRYIALIPHDGIPNVSLADIRTHLANRMNLSDVDGVALDGQYHCL